MILKNAPVRILIVDDDEDDFIITSEYIKHIHGATFKLDWCHKYDEALAHMAGKDYDLYFVDYRLGAKSGVDLLKDALERNCEDPIILLTGKGNYKVDLEAMQLGAVDYLVKTELTIEKMERSIRYAMERAATLKALKANEHKYRSIFEKSKDIVFVTDSELNFKDVNDAVYSSLNYNREEVLQMNLLQLIDDAQSAEMIKNTLQSNKTINDREITISTKSGEKKDCTITIVPVEDYSGTPYMQGIMHDITNLKKMEKATLLAEKLAAAGRLVRTLAHEVRNPLNNITLSVEQIQQDMKDESALLYLDIIQRNSKRISDLITELLNTSKPSEITLTEQTLQMILDDVISSAIDRLTLKRIKLIVNYPNETILIKADKEKLKIALINIVINAVEAMEDKEGVLTINLSVQPSIAVLKIQDNGVGISEENISRLFEPFFTQKRNGMGLGLAFTLNTLQSHKAGIEVASKLGEGTTFTITFPLINKEGREIKNGIKELQY